VNLNPVLEREVRERPRTLGAVVMLTIYLLLVTGVFVAGYEIERHQSASGQVVATSVARIGQQQFEWTLFTMLMLVLFLVPGYTASAIAGERERQTLIPMQLTMLHPRRIVVGKATASVAYLGLLVVATAPLLGLALVIGGVTVGQIVRGLVAVLIVGFVLAMISVMCSALVRRTASATVLAYTITLGLLFGTLALWGGVSGVMTVSNDGTASFAPAALVALNPVMFVSSAIDHTDPNQPLPRDNVPVTPFEGVRQGMHGLQADDMTVTVRNRSSVAIANNPPTPPATSQLTQPGPFRHYLLWALAMQIGLALLAWWAAARRLGVPAEIER
jgi:ABC-type transport system involved in multi-copper enzyme maturation permease subunit